MSNHLCIHHGNCIDGFAGAWVVREALHGDVEFHAGTYNNPPPDVSGRDVIMVDFSFKRPVMLEIIAAAKSVLVLDHHKTAEADLRDLEGAEVIFDGSHSGCMVAWNYFFPGQKPPALLAAIEDRDLWTFKLDHTREIAATLFSYPYDFEIWDKLLNLLDLDELVRDGVAIERKHFKDVAELTAASARPIALAGFRVLAANVPYTLSSDAGYELIKRGSPFGVCYMDTPEGRVFSLRSTDAGPDVSAIAKQFGGGGHRNAAGFRVPLDQIQQFEMAAVEQMKPKQEHVCSKETCDVTEAGDYAERYTCRVCGKSRVLELPE